VSADDGDHEVVAALESTADIPTRRALFSLAAPRDVDATVSSPHTEWWTDEAEVLRTLNLLIRAGVLPAEEADYYTGKPWKWDAERTIALTLEGAMARAGVPPHIGWESECRDLIKLMQARDSVLAGRRCTPGDAAHKSVEVLRTLNLLIRAGVLPAEEADYYTVLASGGGRR